MHQLPKLRRRVRLPYAAPVSPLRRKPVRAAQYIAGRFIAAQRQKHRLCLSPATRKVRAAQSAIAVNRRQAAMFGHWYRDESARATVWGETTTQWAAIPNKPTLERGSRELEGRKQEMCIAICHTRLMMNDLCGEGTYSPPRLQNPAYRPAIRTQPHPMGRGCVHPNQKLSVDAGAPPAYKSRTRRTACP